MKASYSVPVGILLAFLLFLSACSLVLPGSEDPVMNEFATLDEVDQIRIFHEDSSAGETRLIQTITDTTRITSIVNVFRSYAHDWRFEYPYAQPGPVKIRFYQGNEQKLEVMIGFYRKKTTTNIRYYLSVPFGPGKTLTQSEFEELMHTLEVEANLAKKD